MNYILLNVARKIMFIAIIFILSVNLAGAQHRKGGREESKEKNPLYWYGINIGNLSLYNSTFDANASIMGGVKLYDNWKAGLIFHGFYTYIWQSGDDNLNIFDYGVGVLSTVTVYRNYFVQVEVDKMRRTEKIFDGEPQKTDFLMTYLGGGYYYYSETNWHLSITILYNVNPESNVRIFPLDYRVSFVYNF